MFLSSLHIYPIKSLGGISLSEATLTDRGLEYDRRWMLVDANNRFLTQREHPQMALLQPNIIDGDLIVHHKNHPSASIRIPSSVSMQSRISSAANPTQAPNQLQASNQQPSIPVTVWDDTCPALPVSPEADAWFSRFLNLHCRLVYMPDNSLRTVDPHYAHNNELTSFSDGYPLLIIGQASLDDLNSRLPQPLPMNRFRPNLVFTGGTPFQEDSMKHFTIGTLQFFGVKPCARCVMTLIDQQTAAKGKEPLRTLSTYRQQGNKILFGQNLLFRGTGTLRVGDPISLNIG